MIKTLRHVTREVKNTVVGITDMTAPYAVALVESLYQSSLYIFLHFILGGSFL